MSNTIPKEWNLSFEQVKKIYDVEKRLADKLRSANKEERRKLYRSVYNEYFEKLPFHPQFTIKADQKLSEERIKFQLSIISLFLKNDNVFLEIGAGDCSLSFAIAKLVKKVIAIDVSDKITGHTATPDNFELILSDGISIPVLENSIDIAYSNQLMEHLHEEDAIEQLKNIYKSLSTLGIYICITPNRITGPHDVSRFFDRVPTGFHLKEYSCTDLKKLFLKVGFSKADAYVQIRGKYIKFPFMLIRIIEAFVDILPYKLKSGIQSFKLFRVILSAIVVAKK